MCVFCLLFWLKNSSVKGKKNTPNHFILLTVLWIRNSGRAQLGSSCLAFFQMPAGVAIVWWLSWAVWDVQDGSDTQLASGAHPRVAALLELVTCLPPAWQSHWGGAFYVVAGFPTGPRRTTSQKLHGLFVLGLRNHKTSRLLPSTGDK